MKVPDLPCPVSQAGAWPLPVDIDGEDDGSLSPYYSRFRSLLRPATAAEADWEAAVTLGALILTTSSKDLGVASDLGVALWMARDIDGLMDAFAIWLGLLQEDVWPRVWPRDPESRAAHARSFLGRSTGLARGLSDLTWSRKRQRVEAVIKASERLQAELERTLGQDACERDMYELQRALSRSRTVAVPDASSSEPPWYPLRSALLLGEMNLEDAAGRTDPLIAEPIAEKLRDPVFQLCRALLQWAPGFAPAWRLPRLWMWTFMGAPAPAGGVLSSDSAITELTQNMQRLAALRRSSSPAEIENLWQERPWPLWLDPHRVAAEALRASGRNAAAAAVERTVAALLAKAPMLTGLRYDDAPKTRLADDATRRWASRLHLPLIDPSPREHPSPFAEVDRRDLNRAGEALLTAVRRTLRGDSSAGPGALPPPGRVSALLDPIVGALLSFARSCDPLDPDVLSLSVTWAFVRALAPCVDAGGLSPEAASLKSVDPESLRALTDRDRSPLDRARDALALVDQHPLWLDLYPPLVSALDELGRASARAAVEDCVDELVGAVPVIPSLSFEGGVPVASPEARSWLETIVRRAAELREAACEVAEPADAGGRALQQEAMAASGEPGPRGRSDAADPWAAGLGLIASGQVEDGLAALTAIARSARGERVRFEGELRLARALAESGRAALARPILEALDERAHRFQLDLWEPDLAEQVLRARWRLGQLLADDAASATGAAILDLRRRAASLGLYSLLVNEP